MPNITEIFGINMTKALRNFPEPERAAIAKRRREAKTGGNGFWAAMDYEASKDRKSMKGYRNGRIQTG